MKKLKSYSPLFLLTLGLFYISSCIVVPAGNNGRHRGWYKNPNNPHNPASTNPGKGNGNGHGHGHGRGK